MLGMVGLHDLGGFFLPKLFWDSCWNLETAPRAAAALFSLWKSKKTPNGEVWKRFQEWGEHLKCPINH